MRRAAVLAGLIDDTKKGHERVSFVTEGEASLHYAIENGVLADAVKVLVVFLSSSLCKYIEALFLQRAKELPSSTQVVEQLILAAIRATPSKSSELSKR
jgi:hypothetical protein